MCGLIKERQEKKIEEDKKTEVCEDNFPAGDDDSETSSI